MFLNISFFYPRIKKVILLLYKSCTVFIRSSPLFFELTCKLLQNNCINNGVTNGLKERKKACKQLYMVK